MPAKLKGTAPYVQALASSPSFTAYLENAVDTATASNIPLTAALLDLMLELQPSERSSCTADPSRLLEALRSLSHAFAKGCMCLSVLQIQHDTR